MLRIGRGCCLELAIENVFTGGMTGVLLAFVLSGHGGEWTDWMFPPGEEPDPVDGPAP
jgi:hypothetical protein